MGLGSSFRKLWRRPTSSAPAATAVTPPAAASTRLRPPSEEGESAAPEFSGSARFWEERYAAGGTSGAGSYNHLAEFKAEVLNDFVARNRIGSVIEFGSGDGAQLALAHYPRYVGVDVSPTALELCRTKFADRSELSFLHTSQVTPEHRAELSLSLDVIYHLVEDDVFDGYMRQLFDAGERYVIVYASNEDLPWTSPHVRHRRFTTWVEANRPDFVLDDFVANRYPYDPDSPDQGNQSFADFYIYRRVQDAPVR